VWHHKGKQSELSALFPALARRKTWTFIKQATAILSITKAVIESKNLIKFMFTLQI